MGRYLDGGAKDKPLLLGLPFAHPATGKERAPDAFRLGMITTPLESPPKGMLAGDGGDLPLHGVSLREMKTLVREGISEETKRANELILLGGDKTVLHHAQKELEEVWGKGGMVGVSHKGYFVHHGEVLRSVGENRERPFGEIALELASALNRGDWGSLHFDLSEETHGGSGYSDAELFEIATLAGRLKRVRVLALMGVPPLGEGAKERIESATGILGAFLRARN
ncbi:hypothetical protein H8D30_01495 [bacterium]|nr:hypothetical protein [bacterium]